MATIRKRRGKYQVQVRRIGLCPISKTFNALKDAQSWAHEMERQADRGSLPDLAVLQQTTLAALVTRYRDTVSRRKRCAAVERLVLNSFLLHPICRKRLSEIQPLHFAAYRDERLREVKPSTIKRDFGRLRHMFNVARDEWGYPIRENPLIKLQFKGADKRRERRLQLDELERLVQAAKACRNPDIKTIIVLAVETGMRRGEILAIRRTDFDPTNRTLLIRATKTGIPRIIPLTKRAAQLLSIQTDDPLFPLTANAFRLAWERVKKRAGIADLHFHDLRHEAISRLFEIGLSAPEVALISGHRDMRMLARYTHPQRQLITKKLDAII